MFRGNAYTSDGQVRIERHFDDVYQDDFVVRSMKMLRVPCAAAAAAAVYTQTSSNTKE